MNEEFLDFTIDDIKEILDYKEVVLDYNNLSLTLYEKTFLYKGQEIETDLVEGIAPLTDNLLPSFNNIRFEGTQRYYVEDLTEKDYSLESTTPYKINILGHVIKEGAWGDLLCKVTSLLLELYPNKMYNIYDFKCVWTKAVMFSKEKKTNFKSLRDDLYINCNHTALHSCWFLQEILDYFGIDKATIEFLIHRPSVAESKEVLQYLKERFLRGFVYYLITKRNRTGEQAQKVIKVINKYLNNILKTISKSYSDFFLFDNNVVLSSYVKKTKEKIMSSIQYNEKEKKVLEKYLNYLYDYYRL